MIRSEAKRGQKRQRPARDRKRAGKIANRKAPIEKRKLLAPLPVLQHMYDTLFARWGMQKWWPAEGPFEVMVGAILTQNTAWRNVEKAIANLKAANMLDPQALHYAQVERVAELIRPSGYFNVKARRLKNFLDFYFCEADGSYARLSAIPTRDLRLKLLNVNGLGPETVDSILLYALNRPVFVVDAYTRRILKRHFIIRGDESYDGIRELFEYHLPRGRKLFNEFHALIVRAGHHHCRPTARCKECPLADFERDERL